MGGGRGHGHEHGHDHGHGHGHGTHGNPADLGGYLARLEGEDRIAWQKPDDVVRALGLPPGARACDIGVGPGYFALRLARAVGPGGRVYAIDVEPRMIAVLRERLRDAGIANVRPILARGGKPALPPRPCDVILIVNTFHHFPDGPATLRALARRLAPGGRIVNVDFHKRELPVGPPLEQKVSREDFLAAAREAGLEVAAEHAFLPYQYFLELSPAPAARERGSEGLARRRRATARPRGAAAAGPARGRSRRARRRA
jgi:SAM-dependent methyltransferase